ncbi:response regulator [Sulfitobacter sp. S190]|uniref:response regulator n=1 Tax=Sulfitobacter sp. S190 TaxID=2867022 RepID=UPI0021A8A00A|nr:response regulator [Sulfitobacter sp. S190]UWR23143.1 response regulator [Sulfitobacter sp. S190]
MSVPAEIIEPNKAHHVQIIKALLLDDSTFDRARIRRLSKQTELMLHMDEVGSIGELKDAVGRQVYDLILIDYRLPEGDGLEVLAHIKRSELNSDAATVMITGDAQLETAVTAMRNGCHDFLRKDDMNAVQLRGAVMNAMHAAQEQLALAARTQHQREVIRDGLSAALRDKSLQSEMVSFIKDNFPLQDNRSGIWTNDDADGFAGVLIGLDDDDEFIFH